MFRAYNPKAHATFNIVLSYVAGMLAGAALFALYNNVHTLHIIRADIDANIHKNFHDV